MKEIGPFFKELIRQRHITQKAFAQMIGVSEQHIKKTLESNGDFWKVDWLEKACLAMNVHPKRFFDGWPEVKNNKIEVGDIENESFMGTSVIKINQDIQEYKEDELRKRISDLEMENRSLSNYNDALKRVVDLQNKLINDNGIKI